VVQRIVFAALGALTALDSSGNPDALAQACHSLRELMEKVPLWYATVPAPERLPRMGDKVRALEGKWKQMREKTACLKDGNGGGQIDGHLGAWLRKVEEFFAWLGRDLPMRRQRTTEMFRTLDSMQLPLPTEIEELKVDEWVTCRDYFVKVAHHEISATHSEVSKSAGSAWRRPPRCSRCRP